jgi:hypothetical protein
MIPACCGTVGDITDISRMNKHGLPGGVGWLPSAALVMTQIMFKKVDLQWSSTVRLSGLVSPR